MARIVIPLADDFEDAEYSIPYGRLREAGHHVTVVGKHEGAVVEGKRGEATVPVDAAASDVDPTSFDLLLIPGGWSPDRLRTDPATVRLVRDFVATGRPVAAVCHGPSLLIEADAVRGRTLTSWPSVRRDLENAGAKWVDREVVEDGNLITSRKPEDLEAFSDAIIRALH